MASDPDAVLIDARIDTSGFAQDVEALRRSLEEGLGDAAGRTGARIETSLVRAVRSGRLGFEDLKRTALGVLEEIAASAIRSGIGSIFGGGGGGLFGTIGGLLGLPGRATGGPVTPGRGYLVGERGPELFVPTSSGSVTAGASRAGRAVSVSITVNAPAGSAPETLARSSRQVARAVRAALSEE